jgi:hypothetical protein
MKIYVLVALVVLFIALAVITSSWLAYFLRRKIRA